MRVNAYFEIWYWKTPLHGGNNMENFQYHLIMCSQISPKVEIGGLSLFEVLQSLAGATPVELPTRAFANVAVGQY